jgi:glycosyltransferase involved in cell wall biosynthesis
MINSFTKENKLKYKNRLKIVSIVFNEFINDNRVYNQAISLVNNGYEVTVLAISNSKKKSTSEYFFGVKLIRVPLFYNEKLIYKIRVLRFFYHKIFVFLNFIKIAFLNGDIIHCHDLNTLQFGVFTKIISLFRVRLIYDAHEYETQRNGLNGLRWIFVKLKERFLIRFCDRVITVSDTIADEYVRLYGIERPLVVLNCPRLRTKVIEKTNLFRDYFNIDINTKILLYQGYFYHGRGIEIVMKAFSHLELENFVLVFMGEGPVEEIILKHEKFGKSIFIHPFVTGETLLDYTSSADYGIAFIEDVSLSDRYCLPNKLFEYLSAGLPVIGSGLPELKKFIIDNKIGVSASTNDVVGFSEAFRKIFSLDFVLLHQNIINARERFNWSSQEKVLIEFYNELK